MIKSIIRVASEALSRERYALEVMKEYGVTREGIGLSKEPAVCGLLEDIIEAAEGMDLVAVRRLIEGIDIDQVREELLEILGGS
uniref:Uncharacterized protein n=1 Tax=viral metagenome TaxID=1070528 RepID=A0A6M3MG71_9ZZZZ